jgi:hypothetical protein
VGAHFQFFMHQRVIQLYVIGNAPFDARIKWGCTAIAAIIAVVVIAGIWGIIPAESYGWHDRIR